MNAPGGLRASSQAVRPRPHDVSLGAQMKVAVQILREIPLEALFFIQNTCLFLSSLVMWLPFSVIFEVT